MEMRPTIALSPRKGGYQDAIFEAALENISGMLRAAPMNPRIQMTVMATGRLAVAVSFMILLRFEFGSTVEPEVIDAAE